MGMKRLCSGVLAEESRSPALEMMSDDERAKTFCLWYDKVSEVEGKSTTFN